jgi:hypothetical protein
MILTRGKIKQKIEKRVLNLNLVYKATPKEHSPFTRAFSGFNVIIRSYLSPLPIEGYLKTF